MRDTLKRRMKGTHILFVHESINEISVEEDCVRVILEPRVLPVSNSSTLETRTLPQRKLRVDLVLYSGGRNANSEGLNCEAMGIRTGRFGRIEIDSACRTTSPQSVFAVGDVTGAGLASVAQQQARQLAEALFSKAASEGDDDEESVDEWGDLDVQVDEDFANEPETRSSEALFGTGSSRGGNKGSDSPLTL